MSRKKPDRLAVEVGGRIARLRKSKGWSQEEFGRRYGASQKRISEIERGDRELRLGTLRKIADAFGVAPYVLLLPDLKGKEPQAVIDRQKIAGYLDRCDARSRSAVWRVLEALAGYETGKKKR